MNSVKLFQHPDFGSLTTFIDFNGKEYYKVNDVCIALRLANPSQQIKRHVKTKWVFKFDDGLSKSGEALYVSEPGLYALIFRSKTPQADNFQDWVFEEVLPKLRASGAYIMPTATSEQLQALQGELNELKHQHKELKYSYNKVKCHYDATMHDLLDTLSFRDTLGYLQEWLSFDLDYRLDIEDFCLNGLDIDIDDDEYSNRYYQADNKSKWLIELIYHTCGDEKMWDLISKRYTVMKLEYSRYFAVTDDGQLYAIYGHSGNSILEDRGSLV